MKQDKIKKKNLRNKIIISIFCFVVVAIVGILLNNWFEEIPEPIDNSDIYVPNNQGTYHIYKEPKEPIDIIDMEDKMVEVSKEYGIVIEADEDGYINLPEKKPVIITDGDLSFSAYKDGNDYKFEGILK